MAALEGGVAAVAAASGQSAQFMAIAAIAKEGDNIVSTQVPIPPVSRTTLVYILLLLVERTFTVG